MAALFEETGSLNMRMNYSLALFEANSGQEVILLGTGPVQDAH